MLFKSKRSSKLKVVLSALVVLAAFCAQMAASIRLTNALVIDAEGKYYQSDYDTRAELAADAQETNIKIMEEGAVLLKNTLPGAPLAVGSKVTIFGKNSVNPIYSGTGSSGGTSNPVDPYKAFRESGIDVNPTMEAFYRDNSQSGNGRASNPFMGQYLSGLPVGETRATGKLDYGGSEWHGISEPSVEDREYDPKITTADYSNYQPVRSSYEKYSDAAIIFISRTGGEGFDLPRSMRMSGVTGSGNNAQYPAGRNIGNMNTQAGFEG